MSRKISEKNIKRNAGSIVRTLSLVCLMILLLHVRAKADDVLTPLTIQNPLQIDALLESQTGKMCEYILSDNGKVEHRYASITIPERGWLNLRSVAQHGAGAGRYNARSVSLYYDAERTLIRQDRDYSGANIGNGAWYLEAGTYYLDFSMWGANTYGWYGYFAPDTAAGITVSQEPGADGRSMKLTAGSVMEGGISWKYREGASTVLDICREDGNTISQLWSGWKLLRTAEEIKKNGVYTIVAIPDKTSNWKDHPTFLVVEVTGIDERFVVSFDSSGGDPVAETVRVAAGSAYGSLPTPRRTGYTFQGWYTQKGGKGEKITASSIFNESKDITLYAYWEWESSAPVTDSGSAAKYKVTFQANGGKAVSKKLTVAKGQKYGTLPKTTRTGYTFKGWYTAKSGGTKVTASTKYTAAKDTVLYAHWGKKTYKITYKTNGGKLSGKYRKSYTVTTAAFALPQPKRSGYTFLGWSSSSASFKGVTKVKKGSTGNKTFYAFWRQNEKVYTSTSKNGKDTYYRPPHNGANGLDSKMKQHYYLVGTEIPAGEYLLRATAGSGTCYYEVAKQSGASVKKTRSGKFTTCVVIALKKGEYIHFRGSMLIRMSDVTDNMYDTGGVGMFKVGSMIPAGTYQLKSTGRGACYEIHSDPRGTVKKSVNFSGVTTVTLKKGQYLVLKTNCKIQKMPK